jgi:hypothetical protein
LEVGSNRGTCVTDVQKSLIESRVVNLKRLLSFVTAGLENSWGYYGSKFILRSRSWKRIIEEGLWGQVHQFTRDVGIDPPCG